MKRNLFFALTLVGSLAAVATYVLAQQTAPATKAGKLNEAIGLLNEGKPKEARGVITNIPPSDPEFGASKFYDTLALSEAGDRLGLLNNMVVLKTNKAVVPVRLKEELAIRQLDALFHYRKFDELLTNAAVFKQEFANSAQTSVVIEHQLAALFERGMKKTTEACSSKDPNVFNQRWAEGKANLEQFLALAASFNGANYTAIKKHTLSEDIRTARLTLGDEKAVLEEVPIADKREREKVGLLRVNLYKKLQPENVDRNLELMKDFITQFPESKSRKRVEFDMANISFPSGKQMRMEAEALEQAGDANGAAARRQLAGKYFELQRNLENQKADGAAGVDATDVFDLRGDLLYGYFLEKNFDQLSKLTASQLAEAKRGDALWVMAKVYDGIALQSQSPANTKAATAIFDDVLALEFTNKPERDYYLILAARWRSNIANAAGDKARAQEIVQWVQAGKCAKELKNGFLSEYGTAAAPTTNNSK